MQEADIMARLLQTGALLEGHFLLRSGLHSDRYFQAALVLQQATVAAELCGELAARFRQAQVETVISPAIGGIVVGQEVARHLGVRAIFAEKDDQSNLLLRRGFQLRPGERVLVAEDVITKGGRVQQTIDLVRAAGAEVLGVAVLVDRSEAPPTFGVPVQSLVKLRLTTYAPDVCPFCKQGRPIDKPGSK
ncbi:MAG: orotate phosphoribosyltransferase [Lentisphaerae bacterium RIFOXYB12_FULL_65_16]|nr:MAG: orotate phosphoribosyltransferase [Lentisphaerae bacterium RIFOXYA12_64_32]OGV91219.1 MAG: orotate phosphoribosyltransferase [Lentisphaerae bacterium RIFOXYB12_FULL_65_16]